ncbi:filaggrin domain-containing protein [Purpureocillium lilacinum]|uniref:Filaggrin domain-containing protein n=1 Tax=Purpureocillium lilacinum TaxID=33203 RepID=A0A179GZQ4_PURLI|nr:filaggrin domain-containing protein [Purpureocillium lilacinum]OAQ82599.1 filaggrin domain-containing protein [Purpureocillium lilacinum]
MRVNVGGEAKTHELWSAQHRWPSRHQGVCSQCDPNRHSQIGFTSLNSMPCRATAQVNGVPAWRQRQLADLWPD